jgi:hypothetical protein
MVTHDAVLTYATRAEQDSGLQFERIEGDL